MLNAEYRKSSCPQRDRAEQEAYVGVRSAVKPEVREQDGGVMENRLLVKTEEGSPQDGPLSPLLATIYLNEYDQEMARRGVLVIRYADEIVVLERVRERHSIFWKARNGIWKGK